VFADIGKGFHVSRATSTLPQTVVDPGTAIFTISGGRVLITRFIGTVTVQIAATDPVLSVTSDPTTGTAVVLASTADIKSKEVGAHAQLECDGSAMILSNAGAILSTAVPCFCVVPIGNIGLISGDSQAGEMSWDLWYLPLDVGAAVVAV
jgi:hypothetical protein